MYMNYEIFKRSDGWTVLLPKGIYVELNDRKKLEKEINYTQILWNRI
jgi:hypothetical protein